MIRKNDVIDLEITEMSGQGSGIGKYEGMAIFVPLSAVGDKLKVRILKVKKNYAFGKVEEIVVPSEMRIEEDCRCFSKCGGCVFRHISYEEELRIKQKRVVDAIERIGGIKKYKLNPIVGSKNVDSYRNKSQLPIGKDSNGNVIMGYYGNHSHRIVGDGSCKLHPFVFDEIALLVKNWANQNKISVYDEATGEGCIRHLYMRYAEKTNEIMICLVINGDGVPCKEELVDTLVRYSDDIKSIVINTNREKTNVILGRNNKTIYGKGYITDELCNLKFNISPLSFYQVNRAQAERLYGIAAEFADLTESDFLLDLYCGTGTIGLSMANKVHKVLGVEIISQAIENARENAQINGIKNSEFICSDASAAAEDLCRKGISPNVVILDPPRKGCDISVISSVNKMNPEKIVYISCDPETLARDLAEFEKLGYKLVCVTPVDMFPRTGHVETVCLLSRKDK